MGDAMPLDCLCVTIDGVKFIRETPPPDACRIAPWTPPEPPAGQQWHRTDGWTEDMLPEGYRPLLASEMTGGYVTDVDWINEKKEQWHKGKDFHPILSGPGWFRTRRPLPTPPRMVPLGPEDVPPGSVIRGAGETQTAGWCLVTSCSYTGIRIWRHCDPGNQRENTWEDLMLSATEIHRPGDNDEHGQPNWPKCEKEAK